MNLFTIDLYNHFGIEKPEGREGILTAYVTTTPPPVAATRLRPAILVIPGGGYSMVSTRESEPVALRFMAGGYAAFVLKYTCAPATFPLPCGKPAWQCAISGKMPLNLPLILK